MSGGILWGLAAAVAVGAVVAGGQALPRSGGAAAGWSARYFRRSELVPASEDGPDVPDDAIATFAVRVLDPVRAAHGGPIRVTSGYRSPTKNAAVGGTDTSWHLRGLAADLVAIDGSPSAELARAAIDVLGTWDQVIVYARSRGGHLHIGAGVGRGPWPDRRELRVAWRGRTSIDLVPRAHWDRVLALLTSQPDAARPDWLG